MHCDCRLNYCFGGNLGDDGAVHTKSVATFVCQTLWTKICVDEDLRTKIIVDEDLQTNICADEDLRTKICGYEDWRTKICVDKEMRGRKKCETKKRVDEEMRIQRNALRIFALMKKCDTKKCADEDLRTKICATKKCQTRIGPDTVQNSSLKKETPRTVPTVYGVSNRLVVRFGILFALKKKLLRCQYFDSRTTLMPNEAANMYLQTDKQSHIRLITPLDNGKA